MVMGALQNAKPGLKLMTKHTPPHPEPDRQHPSDGGLLPCPFDGGKAIVWPVVKPTCFQVGCVTCGSRTDGYPVIEEAISAWNTRSALRDDMRFEEWELRAGLNIVLETIALKFEANDTFDLWRSDAAALVRGYKHPNTRANPPMELVALIDDLIAGLKREHDKPFSGYAYSATEVLQKVRALYATTTLEVRQHIMEIVDTAAFDAAGVTNAHVIADTILRFFIEHGMIHDRVTGKHVTTEGTPPFEDGVEQTCELLNSLTRPTPEGGEQTRIADGEHKPEYAAQGLSQALARIAEIDAMFESATGWGSWMVMCANEREDLATKFNLPQKYQARCGGERTD